MAGASNAAEVERLLQRVLLAPCDADTQTALRHGAAYRAVLDAPPSGGLGPLEAALDAAATRSGSEAAKAVTASITPEIVFP